VQHNSTEITLQTRKRGSNGAADVHADNSVQRRALYRIKIKYFSLTQPNIWPPFLNVLTWKSQHEKAT
jgi:hypothetical protein